MSATTPFSPGAGPGRRPIASSPTYPLAERAVDWLSDQGFAVEHVTSVGTGVRTVERVSGRITTAKAGGIGGLQGAVVGLLFALLFGIFFTGPGFGWLLLYAVVLGAMPRGSAALGRAR